MVFSTTKFTWLKPATSDGIGPGITHRGSLAIEPMKKVSYTIRLPADPIAQNHLCQQVIGAAGNSHAHAEIELPLRIQIQIDGG